ncbi:hypothetical protein [Oceanobacillus iheyensis HTE831]|uniref:Uncharacterized protein n=1 Tax=Oceanobacillus iheyensis (strain DSM 14371 / CIP 107618 / JCM 11309 / KCTC 3954 / HTE831) TaxID=221109 RepID=Q8ERN9_OCEIH|nr:hypothetical protein [Oceanobacillus iheyensis]BAC13218.1 hypothetical protein [Oceanobacillus iheyensis HTE831]
MGPSLPVSVWIVYYIFFIIVLFVSVYNMKKDYKRVQSSQNLLFIPIFLIINFAYFIQRVEVNELEYLWLQVLSLDLIAIVIALIYIYFLYFFVSSIIHLSKKKTKDI